MATFPDRELVEDIGLDETTKKITSETIEKTVRKVLAESLRA
jgi:hypothetical protein